MTLEGKLNNLTNVKGHATNSYEQGLGDSSEKKPDNTQLRGVAICLDQFGWWGSEERSKMIPYMGES